MGLGVIGLGGSGRNMVRRLVNVGHQCVVYGIHSVSVQTLVNADALGAGSIGDFVTKLSKPRAIWMMVPAEEVDATMGTVLPYLEREDAVIDGGSARGNGGMSRFADLKAKGVHYVAVGTNGASWGEARDHCLTIGGLNPTTQHRTPVFSTMALENGSEAATHVHIRSGGPVDKEPQINHHGVGHHGLTAAYMERMTIVHDSSSITQNRDANIETAVRRHPGQYDYDLNLADIAEVWRRSSVISTWLLDLAAKALLHSPGLDKFGVRVSELEEGRWTVIVASDESVQAPLLTAALYERFDPRGEAGLTDKVLSALRFSFGGRPEEAANGTSS
jgi:6-phosphogluconate dehydrogenase